MARNEADHEDLMRDAVSLVKRVECQSSASNSPCLVGLNEFSWLFVYLGADPMYRFDDHGRLRRAFVDGQLFRTEGATLAMLQRPKRSDEDLGFNRSILVRRDLSSAELDAFRVRMLRELNELNSGLVSGAILRQSPVDLPSLVDEIQSAVTKVINSPEFLAPALVRR